MVVKGADKGSGVVVWGREEYLKEVHNQLFDKNVYEEVTNYPSTLESTIFNALNMINPIVYPSGDLSANISEYFFNKYPKFARFYLFINGYMMFLVDQ